MPVQEVIAPAGGLYRLGHLPKPLAFPPWEYAGNGRFDDPLSKALPEPPSGRFRVLYSGERRVSCFVECLARFRPDPEYLARMAALDSDMVEADALEDAGRIPVDWSQRRAMVHFELAAGQRWLDLRAAATIQTLRSEFARLLVQLRLADLDFGGIRGPDRQLSQAIARWAYEQGYHGLAYRSRFSDEFDLWALFEHRAEIVSSASPEAIRIDDPDLLAAARLLSLTVL